MWPVVTQFLPARTDRLNLLIREIYEANKQHHPSPALFSLPTVGGTHKKWFRAFHDTKSSPTQSK